MVEIVKGDTERIDLDLYGYFLCIICAFSEGTMEVFIEIAWRN